MPAARPTASSTAVSTPDAPAAVGPYSQAVSTGEGRGALVYVSGQIPLDPATGALVDGGIEAQAERVLTNIGAILAAAGLGWADVVKTTVLLADIADFKAVNPPRHRPRPARPGRLRRGRPAAGGGRGDRGRRRAALKAGPARPRRAGRIVHRERRSAPAPRRLRERAGAVG